MGGSPDPRYLQYCRSKFRNCIAATDASLKEFSPVHRRLAHAVGSYIKYENTVSGASEGYIPDHLVRDIDRRERNRSKFVAQAVRRELERQSREELQRSLDNPHSKSNNMAEQDLEEWSRTLPEDDTESLLENGAGKAVRWVPGQGWME